MKAGVTIDLNNVKDTEPDVKIVDVIEELTTTTKSWRKRFKKAERKKFKTSELQFGVLPENLMHEPKSFVGLFMMKKHEAKDDLKNDSFEFSENQ